ncbi:hypothetical protein DFO66_103327 [Brevibacterium sanguinis]|uniref:Uncharacterized protein n=2 Tax=Brevibacterium TaxID=1696 RepID=A0A366IKU3_9MICO|nr:MULTISPECIES: hypothetical protein [Brevibacterium]RBP66380.1 hypothetical protein DFO66_103327 [Brevibacterium sanguinis]RBP73032.1 hypothetical protein DFO65_103327 [Brevibacterium celere]
MELTPVKIEQHILGLSNRIANSAAVCNDRYLEFLTADREYDRAYAQAFMSHDGAQGEKRYAAELATTEERERRDVADAAHRYADRLSKALQSELLAYQSLNKSLLAQYQVAGTGER